MLERTIQRLVTECSCCYLHQNEHTRAKIVVETREARFNQWFCETYPHVRIERAAPILHRTRSVKSAEEIERMRHACGITRDGFNRVMNFLKPGVTEYEVEAEYLHEFVRKGSRGFAYTPIVASGANACVLHYIENSAVCQDGDVLLMDVGAEYGNYASDMTRCLPVSGRFTDRQRKVYDAVLSVMRDATKLLRPGVSLHDYHKQVGELMTDSSSGWASSTSTTSPSRIPPGPPTRSTSCTARLTSSDSTSTMWAWHEPIRAGHVFTVEPGIYILEEGLGIRLENDIVVTEDGFDDLMGDIPLDAEAIEDAMNS